MSALSSYLPSNHQGHPTSVVRKERGSAAFTLVELLVAMTVGTIMIVFLFQVFNASVKAWRQGEDQTETYREARAAMQMMVRDLSQTIQPMTASVYASPTPVPGSIPKSIAPVLVIDRYPNPVPPQQAGDEINEEVYCMTTITNNGASNLCAVGYFCSWKPDLFTDTTQKSHAPQAYSLMRQYLGSGAPQTGANAAIPGLYDRFSTAAGTLPLTFINVYERATPPQAPTGTAPQAQATELAAYIWDLQIRTPDSLQTLPTTPVYPAKPTYMGAQSYANVLPAYVEIRFKALSESAARQLEGNGGVGRQTWNDSNPAALSDIYKRIILPGTRPVFRARADLQRQCYFHAVAMIKTVSLYPIRGRRQAFALVLVLSIVSVLALVAVAFLSSMSQERATANAFANKARAEQSAQAGVDTAMGILRDYFKAFPDSVTAWDTTQSQYTANPAQAGDSSHPNEGTSLFFHAVPAGADVPDPSPGTSTDTGYNYANYASGNNPNNVDASGGDARSIYVLPLVSGATVKLVANKANNLPTLNATNSINLNARRRIDDTQGWIGTYPATGSLPKPINVPWVDIRQQDGVANGATQPVVGRYAFWVEDESFRANISYADGGQVPASPRRDNDPSLSAAKTPLNPTDLSLLGLFAFLGDSDPSGDRTKMIATRKSYPGTMFPEGRAYAHTTDLKMPSGLLSYITTSQSAALNLSRHGTQRLNLNTVVPQADLPADVTKATPIIQNQIDQIVATIKFHTPSTQSSYHASYFGQRFFRTATDTSASTLNALQVPDDSNQYPLIYLYKVAANIRDYIDKDPTPTIINAGGTVRYGTKAKHSLAGPSGLDGSNEIWAQGKDSAPYIEETATRFRGGHLASDLSKYQVAIDYYVEVWNSCNQEVKATDLGPHPVVRVANPTQWISTSPTDPTLTNTDPAPTSASPYDSRASAALRDYDIDLVNNVTKQGVLQPNGVTFAAGIATVITTDPQYAQVITDTNAQANVYVCGFYPAKPDPGAVGKRIYNGKLPFLSDGKTYAAGLKMVFGGSSGAGSTGSSDYDTELLLETDYSIIDSTYGGLPIYNGGSPNVYLTAATQPDPNLSAVLPVMGGSLHGNNGGASYPAVTGDPRSNNEQLIYTGYKSGGSGIPDQSRYYVASGTTNLGLPNSNYIKPEGASGYIAWGDYYTFPAGNTMTGNTAPYVIANSTLTSIGQLGDIYDPLRVANNTANIGNARGGGRTFKIGQHDDRWDGSVTSPSHSWASWRLVDFFCISDVMEQPGLININGVARDNGTALRTALGEKNVGFKFQSTTTAAAQPAGNTLTTDTSSPGLQSVIDQIKARLATPLLATFSNGYSSTDNTGSGPFFERGELSELPVFGQNATGVTASTNLVSGVDMAKVFDRGREELFRRLVEMITTRGNVFTVYAVGQALVPTTNASRQVLSTHQLRVTFKLVPKGSNGLDFHPAYDKDGNLLPLVPASPNDRFAKPDHYDVQVLSVSSGNG